MLRQLISINLTILFESFFNRSKMTKMKKNGKLGYILLIVYIIGALGFSLFALFSELVKPLVDSGFSWLYFALAITFALSIGIFGSVFFASSLIYSSKDNELLLSMPIKVSYILISRTFTLLVLQLVYVLLVMIPAVLAYCFQISVDGSIIVKSLIASLLLLLLVCGITCLLGWIIRIISVHTRHRNIVSIVLTLVFLFGYMYLSFNIQNYLQAILQQSSNLAVTIKTFLPLSYAMGALIANTDLVSICTSVVFTVLPFSVIYYVLSINFIKTITTNKGENKIKYVEKKATSNSAFVALLKKEFTRFFTTPIYLINQGLGGLMLLIASGYLLVAGGDSFNAMMTELFDLLPKGSTTILAMIMLIFVISLTAISAVTISLEGKSFYILKSLPVKTETILMSKAMINVIYLLPPVVIFCVVYAFVLEIQVIEFIIMLLSAIAFVLLIAFFGLACNINFHILNWRNETIVVKQSKSVMILIFGGMGLAFIYAFSFIKLSQYLNSTLISIIWLVIFALCAAISYYWDMHKGVKKFDAIN